MLRGGLVSVHDFVTVLSADMEQDLLPSLVTADNITDFFAEYDRSQARVAGFSACGVLMAVGPAAGGGNRAGRAFVSLAVAGMPAATRMPTP